MTSTPQTYHMTLTDWNSPDRFLPADGQEVLTMDSGGHVQPLTYDKGMWWITDDAGKKVMYVYYTPTFWRDR